MNANGSVRRHTRRHPSHRSRRRSLLAAGLLALTALAGCGDPPDESPARPNVLLVLVDTLRADHLGLYGYPRATSPALDALAADATVFDNHIASSAQTVPSTLSMLLSVHPAEHGFLHLGEGHFGKHRPHYPDALHFLQEVFGDAGYATAGFVGNPFLKAENGFAQGFDTFLYSEASGAELTAAAIEWLDEPRPDDRPVFVYLHYFDVHSPYEPPPEYRDRFERPDGGRLVYRNGPIQGMRSEDLDTTVSLYDGGIAFVDDQVAELVDAFRQRGLWDDTLLAFTSDHGEEFLEHGGLGHGTSVYGELVRVPLLLRAPGQLAPGRRIERLTHHIDLAPTLLELAGIAKPTEYRGGRLTGSETVAYADDGTWLAVYAGDEKLIVDRATGRTERYQLDDRHDQRPLDTAALDSAFDAHVRWYGELERIVGDEPDPAAPRWSEEELERLEALGYVQ